MIFGTVFELKINQKQLFSVKNVDVKIVENSMKNQENLLPKWYEKQRQHLNGYFHNFGRHLGLLFHDFELRKWLKIDTKK